jgi:protein-disulfide isomerase
MTSLDTIAARLDLDMDAITPLMTSDATNDIIRQNRQLAQRLGISGTPTFVLDEQMLRGYVPLDGMQQIVADVRAN